MKKLLNMAIGFFGLILLSVAAIILYAILTDLYPTVVWAGRIILYAFAAVVILAVVFSVGWLWDWYNDQRLNRQLSRDNGKALNRRLNAEASEAERKALIWETVAPAGHQVYRHELRPGTYSIPLHLHAGPVNGGRSDVSIEELDNWRLHQLAHGSRQTGPQAHPLIEGPAEPPQPRADLLDLLQREQRLLILGPSGSGKSSLLKHVVAQKIKSDTKVILCDPHGSRPKWGPYVDAVGFGERFEQILETFQALEFEHKERIRKIEFGHGERDFQIVTVVIEEVQALVEYFNGAGVDIGYFIRMFLTRTRKTGLDIIAVSQEDSVKALGVEGFGKNRAAFATARTTGRDGHTEHKVILQSEHGESLEYQAPPFWPSDLPVGVAKSKVILLPPPPTAEEQQIIDILRSDPAATDYRISMEVFKHRNQRTYELINAVRERFEGVT